MSTEFVDDIVREITDGLVECSQVEYIDTLQAIVDELKIRIDAASKH